MLRTTVCWAVLTLLCGCGSGSPGAGAVGGADAGSTGVDGQGTPQGGTIALAGIGSVQLGAGAVSSPVAISVRAVEPRVALPGTAVSQVVEFTPHGAQFAVPARITLQYASTAAVADLSVMRLADDAAAAWTDVGGVRFEGGAASFETTRFSSYAVVQGHKCTPVAVTSSGACTPVCAAGSFCSEAAACVSLAQATLCENKAITVIQGELPDLAVVAPQQTSDAAYAAQISGALAQQCGATVTVVPQAAPGVLDPCTDAPLLGTGNTVLLVGGGFGQRLARWLAKGNGPIVYKYDSDAKQTKFTSAAGTVLAKLPDSGQTPAHDWFVIALVPDPARGALIAHAYGLGWEGTPAAAWYFVNRVLTGRTFAQYALVEWTDDGDGVKGASDTWKVLAADVP